MVPQVLCNNDACNQGIWMHGDCFREWESKVLAYLRSSGRARSWSEKQRVQNLWTKKGYDLAFKACDCKCGRGHLRQVDHDCFDWYYWHLAFFTKICFFSGKQGYIFDRVICFGGLSAGLVKKLQVKLWEGVDIL